MIPCLLKRAKVVAILKPGKPVGVPDSYRPIALLSVVYKLLERVIYNRISGTINAAISQEQAGFRPHRNCTDQVLALTTHIENGFQSKKKSAAVFVDLTAAYDTVWRQGLLYKLLKIVPCIKIYRLLENALSNRPFQVHLGGTNSSLRTLNNGLPQGSVLAPLLFNLYIHDLPNTRSRKFAYADDLALVTQEDNMEVAEVTLEKDLELLDDYFFRWRLCPSALKTEVACFHLCNKLANKELRVKFRDKFLRHNLFPKYLGITLDRSLNYKEHLNKLSGKLKSRNSIIQKLTGTTWGANAATNRTTALSLVYSSAEYCSAVWLNSTHTSAVDTQLNHTMRLFTGCLKSTPTFWLPALCHIIPPSYRREKCLDREIAKIRTLQLSVRI